MEKAGREGLAGGGVEWGGECAGCCWRCHLTTGVRGGAPRLHSCRGRGSLRDLVSRLEGSFRPNVRENIAESESEKRLYGQLRQTLNSAITITMKSL